MTDCAMCRIITNREGVDFIAELPHSVALLNWQQHYRGRALVVLKRHATDLTALPAEEMAGFTEDMRRVARAIAAVFQPARLNYAILGNADPHLHWHIYPRYPDDGNFGGPPWPSPDSSIAPEDVRRRHAARIRAALAQA
ncbi:MAG: HIT family protein [Chloroflexota bacterium]